MNSPTVPEFTFANCLLAALLVPLFITIMSLIKEPLRQKINAGLIAVAEVIKIELVIPVKK